MMLWYLALPVFRFFEGELFAIIFSFYLIVGHAFMLFGSIFSPDPVRHPLLSFAAIHHSPRPRWRPTHPSFQELTWFSLYNPHLTFGLLLSRDLPML